MKSTLLILGIFISAIALSFGQNCSHAVDSDNFNSASGWTQDGVGKVFVANGVCRFDSTLNGYYDRIYRPLATTLFNNYFKAELTFSFEPNPGGYGVGALLLGLGAGTLDFLSYDGTQGYAATDQDGLGVILASQSTSTNNIANWYIEIISKKGSNYVLGTNYIYLNSSIFTYYLVFERIGGNSTSLKLYSDAAHTNMVGNTTLSINSNISGLNYMQFGNTTWGWFTRMFIGSIDDVVICDDGLTGINENNSSLPVTITQNNDGININSDKPLFGGVEIYSITGQLVYHSENILGEHNFASGISKGVYALRVRSGNQEYIQKLVF